MTVRHRTDVLRLHGARQNNLKNLDLEISHDALVAVTGVSGSGKSSLAFDTLFAEGQWRYLESLPSYARMLMEKGARPDVDLIENVRPAIALEQQNQVKAARSTVGTLTELHDLFRLLWASAADYRCPACGQPVRFWTPRQTARELVRLLGDGPVTLEVTLAPFLDENGDDPRPWHQRLSATGFARVRLAGEIRRLDAEDLPTTPPEEATLVIDRVSRTDEDEDRLVRAVDETFRHGRGSLVAVGREGVPLRFSSRHTCDGCGKEAPELRPVLFSYNHPLGACPTCTGFGAVLEWDETKVVPDPDKTLADGAVEPWQKPANRWWQKQLEKWADAESIPLDRPWRELDEATRARVWKGTPRIEGVQGFFDYLETKRYKMHVRVFMARYRSPRTCVTCDGARLTPEALAAKVAGRSIAEASALPLDQLCAWVRTLSDQLGEGARELLWRIEAKLDTLLRLGLHYLTPDRASRTLSGGEMQRVALARQLANRLTRTLYVLDEPSVGLHPKNVHALAGVLDELARQGNTVVFVEHDGDMILRADEILELGPGGGHTGGELIFQGNRKGLLASDTPTGRYLTAHNRPKPVRNVREPRGWLTLSGCDLNNLRDLDVRFPLGTLTCVTGVSGSGKSSLVEQTLEPCASSRGAWGPARSIDITGGGIGTADVKKVQLVGQDPMGRTPRSIPLTYLDAYTPIRKLFAGLEASRRLGLTPAHFSFNTGGGRCEPCAGTGYEKLEMLFFEDLYVPCQHCHGKRFTAEVLSVRYKAYSIHDVLALTVEEALNLFRGLKGVEKPLRLLLEMGLGYLVLGQPANTLSGGEAQRLKIAAELTGRAPRDVLYLLDEPTTGLHGEDVARLAAILERLVEAGNSVVVVEHNLDFIARADWVIDLGPGGGEEGGRIVDAGPPAEVAARKLGPTGQFLADYLAGR